MSYCLNDEYLYEFVIIQYFQGNGNAGCCHPCKCISPQVEEQPKSRTRRQADTISEIVSRLTTLEASHRSHLSRLNTLLDSLNSPLN